MDLDSIRRYRECELGQVLRFIPCDSCILEIGAGAGWQSKWLAERGYSVTAVDIESSNYREIQEFPITVFDGIHLPFKDNSFDVIFSSNVLEHVRELQTLDREIWRALREGGTVIHVLPSGTWSFWTSVTHYVYCVKHGFELMRQRLCSTPDAESSRRALAAAGSKSRKLLAVLKLAVCAQRHGERGLCEIHEVYLFSHFFWSKFFHAQGWNLQERFPVGIFYTGYSVLGRRLSFAMRVKP